MMPVSALGGAAGGSLLSELLGIGDPVRRQLMQMAGQGLTGREDISQGSELLAAMGADPEGGLARLGGFGLDTLADPMTWLGMAGGAALPAAAGTAFERGGGLEAMKAAADAAVASNARKGISLAPEQLRRVGRAVTPDDVTRAGPREALYARNPTRQTGMEAGSTVPENLMQPLGPGPGAGTRRQIADARQLALDENAGANDAMLEMALEKNYGNPAAVDDAQRNIMSLPGMMLSPQNPLRDNFLMQMEPSAAQAGIDPLLALMQSGGFQRPSQAMSPWELAMLGGTGAGAIGGGVYAGMQPQGGGFPPGAFRP